MIQLLLRKTEIFNTYVGIDPGLSGAIAIQAGDKVTVSKLPTTGGKPNELYLPALLTFIRENITSNPVVVLEKVHAMPKQGVSSTFKFGDTYGQLKGLMAGLEIPYSLVTPQQWKKKVLVGLNWKGNKAMSIEFCMRRFAGTDLMATPCSRVPHDGIADALCMSEYARLYMER